jgi:hypothetical protein
MKVVLVFAEDQPFIPYPWRLPEKWMRQFEKWTDTPRSMLIGGKLLAGVRLYD